MFFKLRNNYREILTSFLCFFIIDRVNSQEICPNPFSGEEHKSSYTFYTKSIFQFGTGIGFTTLIGDRKNSNANGLANYINFDVRLRKGVFFGLRSQFGTLNIESGASLDNKQLTSKYTGLGAGLLFYPYDFFEEEDYGIGELFFKRYLLSALYVGVDVLNVSQNIKSIYRNISDLNSYGPIESYDEQGLPIFKTKLNSVMLPSVNIGFSPMVNFRKMKNSSGKNIFRFVLNAQFNFSNNDLLDGYAPIDVDGNRVNEGNDSYRFYSLGLRYSF